MGCFATYGTDMTLHDVCLLHCVACAIVSFS
jgi:hypothetical protein